MQTNIKLSIVVPCYNEAGGLPNLLTAYAEVVNRDDIEVVLVNNGSTDNTSQILESLSSRYLKFLTIVTVTENQGYGSGVLSGLKEARGEFIGWTHGDLQTHPRDVIKALSIIEGEYENRTDIYCKGLRYRRPLYDSLFTFGMSVFETLYLRQWLRDINAQPNIFHRSFFETWQNPPHDFSLDLYALYEARRSKLTIVRFPVFFLPRAHGHSSWNTGLASRWKFIKRTLSFSFALKKRLK
ncbi:MAG: hypothetical protein RL538_570 [Candidatus Parcubacteria bacterium]|jgi:glycosyltransferase involved in cell wall biosynthesis